MTIKIRQSPMLYTEGELKGTLTAIYRLPDAPTGPTGRYGTVRDLEEGPTAGHGSAMGSVPRVTVLQFLDTVLAGRVGPSAATGRTVHRVAIKCALALLQQ